MFKMYQNTREYVNNKFVRPVLLRAGSVKQIGSQAANAAADRLDGALTVADKYVDHYLPADPTDKVVNGKTKRISAFRLKACRKRIRSSDTSINFRSTNFIACLEACFFVLRAHIRPFSAEIISWINYSI